MARKKGTPQKAPEYKKKAPGKAKDGSACYTRQGNAGSYVTCTGTQKSSGSGKAVRSGPPPKGTKKGMAKRTGGAPGKKTAEKNARLDARKALLKRGTERKKILDEKKDTGKRVVKKSDFDKAVSDMRDFAATNPIGRAPNASLPYQSLAIQTMKTQAAMDKSNAAQAELEMYLV